MKKSKVLLKLTGIFLCLALVCVLLPVPALAAAPPMVPYGDAYVNGVKAKDGTLVQAKINGKVIDSCTTPAGGAEGHYVLTVPGEHGDEVSFFIRGEEIEAQESPKSWSSGTRHLDLNITMAAPVVTTSTASDITTDSATLNGSLDDLGDYASVDVSFVWGGTLGGPYPNETTPAAMTSIDSFSAPLTELASDTTHYFKAKATGSVTVYGDELSFTTEKVDPEVTTSAATVITDNSATLNGSLDNLGDYTPVDVSFVWGGTLGGPYPNETTPAAMTSIDSFSAPLAELASDTTYYFKAKATGSVTVYGDELSFTTEKAAPVAEFSAIPLTGDEALTVVFTDESLNMADGAAWSWGFGDGDTSTEPSPTHEYLQEGSYTVTLTVTTAYGSDDEVKADYVVVADTEPVASFSADPTTGSYPLEVSFTDTSTSYDGITWEWDFSYDGVTFNVESTDQNPSNTYEAEGTYTVALRVTEADADSDMMVAEDLITVTVPPPPVAEFSAIPLTGDEALTVVFTDESLNMADGAAWSWGFGDGDTSTEPSPTHDYIQEGSYTVTLTVTTAYGSDDEVKADYIVVADTEPVASFTADPTTGSYPLEVSFTDTSTSYDGITWEWDFSYDGVTFNVESTDQNPSNTYEPEGIYSVALRVTEADADSDMMVAEDLITVTVPPPPVAEFSAIPLAGDEPLTVAFADESLNMVGSPTWSWAFGDGDTSTLQNPTHEYLQEGSYTVTLAVTTDFGSDDEVKADYVVVADTEPVASFSADPTTGSYPLEVSFTDTSTSYDGITWEWDFSYDGVTFNVESTDQNPSNTYEPEGTYTVALRVTEADADSDMMVAEDLITVTVPPDVTPPVIEYTWVICYVGAESARPGEPFELGAMVTDDTAVILVEVETPFGTFPLDIYEYEGVAIYWVVTEVPEGTEFGTHELTVIAEDEAGNTATQTLELEVVPVLTAYNVWLADGWNLISLPLIPDVADAQIVLDGLTFFGEDVVRAVWGEEAADGMMSGINVIWYYDATGEYGTAGDWLYFVPATELGDLTEIEDGKGYWVDVVAIVSEEVPPPMITVYGVELVSGPTLPPTYDVVEGWNLSGFKETTHMPFDQYLSAVDGKYARIYGYDAYNQRFYLVGPGGLDYMTPASGYWIYMTDSGYIVP